MEILQINLGRSRAASAQLEQTCSELNPSLVCIQEPYVWDEKIVGIPIKFRVVSSITPKTAIIIREKDCTIFPLLIKQNIVAIECSFQDKVIIIINVYISPTVDLNDTLVELDGVIRQCQNKSVILTGDFNAKNIIWGGNVNDERGEQLSEFFLLHNIFLINDKDSEATFQSSNGTSWIDLSLASGELIAQVTHWDVLDNESLSDHKYISFGFFNKSPSKIRKLTQQGISKLFDIIKEDQWLSKINIMLRTSDEIENILGYFYYKFQRWIKKCERNVKIFGRATPWWTEELKINRLKNNAHRRRYQRCYNVEMRLFYKQQYINFRNNYKEMIETAKLKSWHNFCFEETKRSLFGIPYKLAFNKIKAPIIIPPIIKTDNSKTESHVESVEYILEMLYKPDNILTDSTLLSQLRHSTLNPCLGSPDFQFTYEEIDTIITTLRNKTAPGIDKINVLMIKQLWNYHHSFVQVIFNSCLETGYFPKIWKIGKVLLLSKPGRNDNKYNSYRPICLNSLFGKILERLLHGRLYYYLVKSNLMHPNQFGFTHNKSSTIALYNLVQHLQTLKQNGKTSLVISLDFSGAFDTVCYPFILHFLQEHKCPCNIFNLLSSFFRDRHISYITEDHRKINKKITLGCPQGSPLSPLLWNILIHDLLLTSFPSYVYIQAFADDVILVIEGLSRRDIEYRAETALTLVHNWAEERKLQFNYDKCFCMLIAIGTKYQKRNPIVKFNRHKLKVKSELKLLGIIFDSHLSFLPHVTNLKNKVLLHTTNLARFSATNWGINTTQFRKIYLQSIERYIVYGAPVWWKPEASTHLLRKVISVQRVPLLKICSAFHTAPNISLPILCNIMPINITLNIEIFMFHIFQRRQPAQLYNLRVSPNDIVYPINVWNNHPSQKIAISYNKFNPDTHHPSHNAISLYTDGSVCLDLVGAAFVVMKPNGSIIKIGKYCMPHHATIFDAEVLALMRGIEHLIRTEEKRACDVFTDSLSALQALSNAMNTNPLIHKLKQDIIHLEKHCKISFYFVKGHSGVLGNELADKFASDARRQGSYVPIGKSKKYVKKEIIRKGREVWNENWNIQGATKELFQWIPSISSIPSFFPSTYMLTQVLTGHGRFPFYFQRFKIKNHNLCFCGAECQSIDHYLSTCPSTNSYRVRLGLTPNINLQKQKAIQSQNKMEILREMAQFINDNIE